MRVAGPRPRPLGAALPAPSPAILAGAAAVSLGAVLEVVLLVRGSMLGYAALGILAVAVGALLFADHVFEVMVAWVLLEGIAFPFIRYPYHAAPYFTFDRYVLFALLGALLLNRARPMSRPSRYLAFALGAFVVGYGARALTTDQLLLPVGVTPVSSLQPVADWLDCVVLPFVVFLVAARTITPSRWPAVAKALTFSGVAISLIAILEWVFGFQLATLAGLDPFKDGAAGVIRAGGPYPQPTALGSVIVVCMVGTLYWLQTERAYLLGGTALAIELLGLVPGLTKTVWAAAFVVILLGIGLRRRVSSRTALVAIYGLTTVGVIYFFVKSSPIIAARVTSVESQDNFLGRVATWQQALEMFQNWPLYGVGIEQFIGGQLLVGRPSVGGILPVPSAHNTFLSILAEGGLLATLPLLAIVYTSARVVRACRKLARTHEDTVFRGVLLGGVVGCLFLSMTFSELYEPPAFMFVALLLGIAAARVDHLTRARNARTAGGRAAGRLS
jgi:O-antigen ligase